MGLFFDCQAKPEQVNEKKVAAAESKTSTQKLFFNRPAKPKRVNEKKKWQPPMAKKKFSQVQAL